MRRLIDDEVGGGLGVGSVVLGRGWCDVCIRSGWKWGVFRLDGIHTLQGWRFGRARQLCGWWAGKPWTLLVQTLA